MRVEEREAQRRAEREAHVVAADAASAEVVVDDDYLRARVVYFAVCFRKIGWRRGERGQVWQEELAK